ncbi:MAG: hypothetical protein H7834_15110 [Magnetococcus sp. YQC-9]
MAEQSGEKFERTRLKAEKLAPPGVQPLNARITRLISGPASLPGSFTTTRRLQRYALHLPSLRERERNVIALARVMLHSCPEFAGKELSREVQELLLAYSWPGNVRELRNVVLAAAVDAPRSIKARHILPHLSDKGASITVTPVLPVQERLLAELKERGQQTLAQLHHGLHILKSTLHYHINKLMAQGKIQRLAEGSRIRFTVADDAEVVQQELACCCSTASG